MYRNIVRARPRPRAREMSFEGWAGPRVRFPRLIAGGPEPPHARKPVRRPAGMTPARFRKEERMDRTRTTAARRPAPGPRLSRRAVVRSGVVLTAFGLA